MAIIVKNFSEFLLIVYPRTQIRANREVIVKKLVV